MRPELQRAISAYSLALPRHPLAGTVGERLGRGTGSSVEFMDFRDYVRGDDLRHVDWRSYARTDQLKVRLFREEVSPVLDLVVDLSASMASTELKALAASDLTVAVVEWLRNSGGTVRTAAAGGERLDVDRLVLDGVAAFQRDQSDLVPLAALRPRSLRLVISDFLDPRDPAPQLRRLAVGGGHLYVLQLLDAWELEPVAEGASCLIDCEDGQRLDLMLDAGTIAAYRERLGRLRDAVRTAVLALGGSYACVRADSPERMFRRDLLSQLILQPL